MVTVKGGEREERGEALWDEEEEFNEEAVTSPVLDCTWVA